MAAAPLSFTSVPSQIRAREKSRLFSSHLPEVILPLDSAIYTRLDIMPSPFDGFPRRYLEVDIGKEHMSQAVFLSVVRQPAR